MSQAKGDRSKSRAKGINNPQAAKDHQATTEQAETRHSIQYSVVLRFGSRWYLYRQYKRQY